MLLSEFAPLGLMQLTSDEPESVDIYEALLACFGEQFSTEEGSRIELWCYSRAIELAFGKSVMEEAVEQRLPSKTTHMLPVLERDFGIVPAPNATLAQRRAVLVERFKLPTGGSAFEIRAALTRLLGADFIAYLPTDIDDATIVPAAIGDHPMNLKRPEITRKRVALAGAVSFIGIPQTVAFTNESGALEVGDVVVFDPGQYGLADRVTIDAIGGTAEAPTLTATFTYPHSAGALGVTMPYPEWSSTKRHSLVVLKASAAADPEKRRVAHEEMARRARASSTWNVVEASEDETETVAFMFDEESLDRRTLATVAIP